VFDQKWDLPFNFCNTSQGRKVVYWARVDFAISAPLPDNGCCLDDYFLNVIGLDWCLSLIN
jgi:hypothetical protein